MRVAVIGSREQGVSQLSGFLPHSVTALASPGGAGLGRSVREFAQQNRIALKEFPYNEHLYGKMAAVMQAVEMVTYADLVVAFWDGRDPDVRFVIRQCGERGIPLTCYTYNGISWIKAAIPQE